MSKPSKTPQPRWTAKLEHKKKLTADDAKFVFEQAEKLLKDSVETATTIINRVATLIPIISGIIIALTAYIFAQWYKTKVFDHILMVATLGVVYLSIVGIIAYSSLLPQKYYPAGSLPFDLFADTFFLDIVPDNKRIIRYYVSEIENYQFRIIENNTINAKRWRKYKYSLSALVAFPAFLTIAYLIVRSI